MAVQPKTAQQINSQLTGEVVTISLPPGMTQADFERSIKLMQKKTPIKSSEPVIFEEHEVNPTTLLRVYRDIYKNKEVLSIRKFWRKEEGEDWQPGKGVTLAFDDIDQIISGLQKMREWCELNPSGEQEAPEE